MLCYAGRSGKKGFVKVGWKFLPNLVFVFILVEFTWIASVTHVTNLCYTRNPIILRILGEKKVFFKKILILRFRYLFLTPTKQTRKEGNISCSQKNDPEQYWLEIFNSSESTHVNEHSLAFKIAISELDFMGWNIQLLTMITKILKRRFWQSFMGINYSIFLSKCHKRSHGMFQK